MKTEIYKGIKIYFRPCNIKNYKVFAQVPKITSQYLGIGKTKSEALNQAKDEIDKYLSIENNIEGF